jgi:hypothetical protein
LTENTPSRLKLPVLLFIYLGTETQEGATSTTLNVKLKGVSQSLEEVVVIGYGTQRKKT